MVAKKKLLNIILKTGAGGYKNQGISVEKCQKRKNKQKGNTEEIVIEI